MEKLYIYKEWNAKKDMQVSEQNEDQFAYDHFEIIQFC